MIYLIIILPIILLIIIVFYIRECKIVKKLEREIQAVEQEREELIRKTETLILSAAEKILNKLKDS